jgi:hypothetical protein
MTARRYLLGEASEEECSAIEREYFHDDDASEGIAAAEEALIDDYIAGRLEPVQRVRFERHYLAAPHHRRRVETIRQLTEAAARSVPRPEARDAGGRSPVAARVVRVRWVQPLAVAAAVVLVAAGAVWMLRPAPDTRQTAVQSAPAPSSALPPATGAADRPVATPPPVRVVALSISPVTVRSADETPSLVIPPGTDTVALTLEGETAGTRLDRARAVVRTVAGEEVWQGPAVIASDRSSAVVARVDVPAARLRVDDYVVTLSGADPVGVDRERYRYFLRVRAR